MFNTSISTRTDVQVCMFNMALALFVRRYVTEVIDDECLRDNNLLSLGEIFSASVSHKPCVIVIDGLDNLGKSDNDSQVRVYSSRANSNFIDLL